MQTLRLLDQLCQEGQVGENIKYTKQSMTKSEFRFFFNDFLMLLKWLSNILIPPAETEAETVKHI